MTRDDSDDELRDMLFAAARLDRASEAARGRTLERALEGTLAAAPVEGVDGRAERDEPKERTSVVQIGRRAARALPLALAAAVIAVVVLLREPSKTLQLSPASERASLGATKANPPTPAPSPSVSASPSSSNVVKMGSNIPSRPSKQSAGRERDAGARMRAAPPSLDDEVTTLEHARAALASGNAKKALELLASYQNVLHGTRLTAEATLLKIEALADSGGRSAAADLARRFIEANRGNPLVDRARKFVDPPPLSPTPEVPGTGDVQ